MTRIELDTFRKHRNNAEWRNVSRATCGEYVATGDGENIRKICALMLADGITGPVEVYRGKTPAFHTQTIEQWASGKVLRGEQPEHLKRTPT